MAEEVILVSSDSSTPVSPSRQNFDDDTIIYSPHVSCQSDEANLSGLLAGDCGTESFFNRGIGFQKPHTPVSRLANSHKAVHSLSDSEESDTSAGKVWTVDSQGTAWDFYRNSPQGFKRIHTDRSKSGASFGDRLNSDEEFPTIPWPCKTSPTFDKSRRASPPNKIKRFEGKTFEGKERLTKEEVKERKKIERDIKRAEKEKNKVLKAVVAEALRANKPGECLKLFTSEQHLDARDSRIKRDEVDVNPSRFPVLLLFPLELVSLEMT
uniref:Uncharacterized protein n=1 Tax=Timema bartmani TaxID=61472 RepID=A0A7R9I8A6_9NEOP|nr:unnamed protein product [Timema bartmani]